MRTLILLALVGQGHLGRGAGQAVAAGATADARDDAGPPQVAEDALEEAHGQALARREVLRPYGVAVG